MMNMDHRLAQTQRQQLVLTQKMQQALHILQLSGIELEQYLQQELETNPFLEESRKKEEIAPESQREASGAEDRLPDEDGGFDLDEYSDRWGMAHREGRDLSRNPELAQRRQHFEDSITDAGSKSLRAHLLDQMRLAAEDPVLYGAGERIIIGDIDERGYYTGDIALTAAETGVEEEQFRVALDLIRGFEPTGVGATDVVDCLLMQIRVEHPDNTELEVLVRDHFEALKQRQVPKIAKSMGISHERVEQLRDLLATLNPWPGHEYGGASPQYIVPELTVELVEDEYVVRLSHDRFSGVRINQDYEKRVKHEKMNKDARNYVRAKLDSARWLQRNIEQRQNTILRVGQAIVDAQTEFLSQGKEFMKPLKLQDIADIVGVHESTVARTTRGKYMQTPQGLFELKYFFTTGLMDDSGEAQAAKRIQALVKKIVDEEDKHKPLSDQKISDLLKKQGINVARRTVTKYREGMGILSTTLRRAY